MSNTDRDTSLNPAAPSHAPARDPSEHIPALGFLCDCDGCLAIAARAREEGIELRELLRELLDEPATPANLQAAARLIETGRIGGRVVPIRPVDRAPVDPLERAMVDDGLLAKPEHLGDFRGQVEQKPRHLGWVVAVGWILFGLGAFWVMAP